MKRTEYFATIEEANQYYPDGVPSSVIAIVGDGSQVLVSSDNAATNTQQYFNADLTNDEIVDTMVQTSYNAGFSYGETVTYPIAYNAGFSYGETVTYPVAYNAGYSYGYDIGTDDGYDTGYVAGEAAGATNWIDVLYLDEKAKAESFLGISSWGNSNFYKANYALGVVNQQDVLAFVQGMQNNKTMYKLIKISKDADGNTVITNNTCSINFDGSNIGAIALDGVTYYSKICIWGTLTLAVGDEVIMDCATSIDVSGTTFSQGLFGGYDPNTTDMVTYKCTTAGTYTFGVWADAPSVQDGQAACFVSTMFNYEGSATVPAIAVPTGETSGGGSSEPTAEELDQQAYLFFTQGPGYENENEIMGYVTTCGIQVMNLEDIEVASFRSYLTDALTFNNHTDFPYNIYVTLYSTAIDPEFQWGTWSGYLQPSFNYSTDTGAPIVTMTFTASNNSKIGFGLLPLKYDNDTTVDTNISISTFLKCFDSGEIDVYGNAIYRHLTDIEAGKSYTATFSLDTDPETGVDMPSITLTEVQS